MPRSGDKRARCSISSSVLNAKCRRPPCLELPLRPSRHCAQSHTHVSQLLSHSTRVGYVNGLEIQ